MATQTVELGLDLEKDKPVVVTLVGLFQPIECLSVVAECDLQKCYQRWNCTVYLRLPGGARGPLDALKTASADHRERGRF